MKVPKAYSYLRFSTPEQSKGDSLRRQTEGSRDYAKRHGLDLDETLNLKDLGVSAFRGKNAQEGALGLFLNAVEAGTIRKGSYLLVENLDRLSRAEVLTAFEQFTGILRRGVNVVTLTDGRTYTAAGLNNFSDLLISLSIMQRAHDESALKSKRLGAAWKAKREKAQAEGKILTSRCPAWLNLNRERNAFEVHKGRAKVIRRIFEMTIAGHGKSVIARRFNANGVPTFGNSAGWHPSYVQKILDSDAVCGDFQPMRTEMNGAKKIRVPDGGVIENYFPAIIDRTTFERARLSRAKRRIPTGRKGENYSNLFTGMISCGSCGAAMHYVNKGGGSKGGVYLSCSNARRALSNCNAPSWNYVLVEELLILCMEEVNYAELFPEVTGGSHEVLKRLERQKLGDEALLASAKRRLDNIATALSNDPKQPTLTAKLKSLQESHDRLSASVQSLALQIEDDRERTKSAESSFNQIKDGLKRLVALQQKRGPELYDLRARLHQLLRRTIGGIALHSADDPKFSVTTPNPYDVIAVAFAASNTQRLTFVDKANKGCFSYPLRNGEIDHKRMKSLRWPQRRH